MQAFYIGLYHSRENGLVDSKGVYSADSKKRKEQGKVRERYLQLV